MYELVKIDLNEIEELYRCPWCGSRSFKKYKSFETLELSKCTICNLVFTSTRVKENFIRKYYGMEYIKNFSDASCQIEVNFIPFYKKELNNIKLICNEERHLLEVGCGGGLFSATAEKAGFDVVGQDISCENIENLKKSYGIDGFCGKIEDLDFAKSSFDVVVMHHVLEHVYNLHSFLDKLNYIVKKDGIIVVLIPNLFSIDGIFDKKLYKRILSLPFHNYHFTDKTCTNMFENKGFKVVLEEHSPSRIISDPLVKLKNFISKNYNVSCATDNEETQNISYINNKKSINKIVINTIKKVGKGEQYAYYFKKKGDI